MKKIETENDYRILSCKDMYELLTEIETSNRDIDTNERRLRKNAKRFERN